MDRVIFFLSSSKSTVWFDRKDRSSTHRWILLMRKSSFWTEITTMVPPCSSPSHCIPTKQRSDDPSTSRMLWENNKPKSTEQMDIFPSFVPTRKKDPPGITQKHYDWLISIWNTLTTPETRNVFTFLRSPLESICLYWIVAPLEIKIDSGKSSIKGWTDWKLVSKNDITIYLLYDSIL